MAYINKIVVNGAEVNANQLEGILDKNGNARFIEGAVTVNSDITTAGLTVDYNKWSLSGSHLMIVVQLANKTESTIVIPAWTEIGVLANLPSWIKDKIYPLGADDPTDLGNVLIKDVKGYGTGLAESNNTLKAYMEKTSDNIKLMSWSTAGYSNNYESGKYYRIQMDLIVDNA